MKLGRTPRVGAERVRDGIVLGLLLPLSLSLHLYESNPHAGNPETITQRHPIGPRLLVDRYHLEQNPVDPPPPVEVKSKGSGSKPTEPHYMDFKWQPELHLATRDCTCTFWDDIG